MSDTPLLHPTTSARHRFHLLDALRGIAAVLILLRHTVDRFVSLKTNTYLAVDFFFCLSGFVVAFSYEDRLRRGLRLRDFLAARAIRLYPTYFVCVLCGAVPFLFFNSGVLERSSNLWPYLLLLLSQLLFLPNLGLSAAPSLFPFDFTAWSLFAEIVANVLYGAGVRYGRAGSASLLLLAGLSLVFLVVFTPAYDSLDVGMNLHPNGPLGLARAGLSFSLGVLLLRVYRQGQHTHLSPPLSMPAAVALAAVFLFVMLAPFPFMRSKTSLLASVALIFPGTIWLAAHCRVPQAWIPACVFLGNVSYPLYLLQAPALRVLDIPAVERLLSQHARLAIVWLMAAIVVLAHLMFQLYDVPVRRWLTRRYNDSLGARA